jgi:hypothetical protein
MSFSPYQFPQKERETSKEKADLNNNRVSRDRYYDNQFLIERGQYFDTHQNQIPVHGLGVQNHVQSEAPSFTEHCVNRHSDSGAEPHEFEQQDRGTNNSLGFSR